MISGLINQCTHYIVREVSNTFAGTIKSKTLDENGKGGESKKERRRNKANALKEFKIFCPVFVNTLKMFSDVIASASLEFTGTASQWSWNLKEWMLRALQKMREKKEKENNHNDVYYVCTLSLHFFFSWYILCIQCSYIETQIQCLAWQNKNGSSERNKVKYKMKKMCSTKMNARSSTSFGICIFHLSLQIGRSKEWTMLDVRCSMLKMVPNAYWTWIWLKRETETTKENECSKQVERFCTMPFWRDAVYRLQAVNFQIDVCWALNRCFDL